MKFKTKSLLAIIGLASAGCAVSSDFSVSKVNAENGPILQTASGALIGTQEGSVLRFAGVPYAEPPLGDLRWRPPQPISWDGLRDASNFQLPCLQPTSEDGSTNPGGVSGDTSEDCLYLNVWAPEGGEKAPIMLWVHGGGGYLGAGSLKTYDGTFFARNGVILVSINYRLGMLGQFAHPALSAAASPNEGLANYQIMDVVAALQWIQENGAALGGDTENVTLFGESAGGVLVANMLSTPPSRGLFQKAIIESAVPQLGNNRTLKQAEADGIRLASGLGLRGANASPEELRALPAEDVISHAVRSPSFLNGSYLILDGRVRTTTTGAGFVDGTTVDVPLIVGSNSAEFFGPEASRMAALASVSGDAPAWQYYFDYVPEWLREKQPDGAPHAAELPYVFNTFSSDPRRGGGSKTTVADQAVVDVMHACWVAFAFATLGADKLSCGDDFVWDAYNPGTDMMAIFRAKPSMQRARPIIEESIRNFPMRPDIGEPLED